MKASSSEVRKVKEDSEGSDEDSFKEENMRMLVQRYNQYIKKHKLKHSDKNSINFKRYYLGKREEKKKEKMLHATNVDVRSLTYNMPKSQQTQQKEG